ncbi:MAG TPA: cytochrome c [Rudaea sp.]|nr:cytochrome c [Rudaea sp.]
MTRLPRILALCLAAVGAAAASAQTKPDAAIRYRQGLMAAMGWNVDQLGANLRSAGGPDLKDAATRAERLAAFAPQIAEGFPKGSDKGAVTDAGPEIWSDAAGFQAALDDYAAASKKFADVVKSGDAAAIKDTYRKVVASCKACHDKYKAD